MPSTATSTTTCRREERVGLNGEGEKAAGTKRGEEKITTWKRKRERTEVIKLMIDHSSGVEFLMSSGRGIINIKTLPQPKGHKFLKSIENPGLCKAPAVFSLILAAK